MKIYLILIMSVFCLNSCKKVNSNNKQIAENGNRIVYNQETWHELQEKDKNLKVEVIDTFCINQKERAKSDIEKGILTYYYTGLNEILHRSNTEMSELLSKYNIGIDSTLTTCLTPPLGFENYCYEKEMRKAIDEKHGVTFIDSLRLQAEKKYVLKNLDKIYEFQDCDTIARYPRANNYKEHFDNYQIDYFKSFKYPKGYKHKNERASSYTTAEFILHKDSSVSNIIVKTTFQNSENEKHRKLFDKRMTDFIKKTNWIPAKSAGITVESKMPITVFYK